MKRFALPLLAVLLLAGCSAPASTTGAAEAETPTPALSDPPAADSPTDSTPPEAASTPADITFEVKTASPELESYVVSATVTEPGRVSVESTLIDPRGDSGSAEALLAIQLCNDVVGMREFSYVSIMENDGSSWVLYGHPSYGNTCTEV